LSCSSVIGVRFLGIHQLYDFVLVSQLVSVM
jgi:hypothetical protein